MKESHGRDKIIVVGIIDPFKLLKQISWCDADLITNSTDLTLIKFEIDYMVITSHFNEIGNYYLLIKRLL